MATIARERYQMTATESVEQARRLARTALAAMARLGVAPTPNNYMVWYSHCSGCYPELSRRIDALQARGEGFSEDLLAELYEQFFGAGRQVRLLNETCERIEATMTHLLSLVGGVTRDAGSYGDQLARFGDALEGRGQIEELRDLVREVLAATRTMQQRAAQLEMRLEHSSRQIELLRTDLASAQREANTDSLTGIANRKYFDHELRAAAEEAVATAQPLCLLLADIDRFKQFNDRFGHQTGDRVLRLVAQVLTRSIKGRDLAARYGGEEFAIILPQTDLDGARALANQIRFTVAGHRIRTKPDGADLGRITMSIGCARYVPGEALTSLIQRADEALYRAKRAGRNRVVAAQAALGPAGPARPVGDDAGARRLAGAG